jgi:hypothetical protein
MNMQMTETEPTRATQRYKIPALRKIMPDILAFVFGLGIAWLLKWKTADLIWSLWLGSLVLGYLTIISTIAAPVYLGFKAFSGKEAAVKVPIPVILIGTAVVLFYLAFFSVHFCGFHAGHAVFLSSFFPISGLSTNAFGNAFMNPFILWKTVFGHLMPIYGIFLIPAVIAERKYVFASLIKAVKSGDTPINKVTDSFKLGKAPKGSANDPFFRPYINVIRMHLLIFFFAFCHALKIDSFLVYAVVYLIYFFPWKAFSKDASDIDSGEESVAAAAKN